MQRLGQVLAFLMLAACAMQSKGVPPMDRFAWMPTASAPADYPMWIVEARLTTVAGDREMTPDRQVINNGWGEVGALRIEGPEQKAVPDQLRVSFYSFVEDRFYAGIFAMPIARMRTLFASGAPRPDGRAEPINRLVVGVAPGGRVGVWLAGGQIATTIGHFVAAPADTPWSAVGTNAAMPRDVFRHRILESTLSPDTLRRIGEAPPSAEQWEAARQSWTLRFVGDGRGGVVWLRGLDGARDWISLDDSNRRGVSFVSELPLPGVMTIRWNGAGGPLRAEVAFDADEVRAAFRRIAAGERMGPLVLRIEPADTGATVDFLLQRDQEIYRFKRARVRTFGG